MLESPKISIFLHRHSTVICAMVASIIGGFLSIPSQKLIIWNPNHLLASTLPNLARLHIINAPWITLEFRIRERNCLISAPIICPPPYAGTGRLLPRTKTHIFQTVLDRCVRPVKPGFARLPVRFQQYFKSGPNSGQPNGQTVRFDHGNRKRPPAPF